MGNRLTMLVSCSDWTAPGLAEQLPALLERVGIQCLAARSGEETQQVLRVRQVHIAVIDLAIPLRAPQRTPGDGGATAPTASDAAREAHRQATLAAARATQAESGGRLLQLLRRLDAPPPTIVIRPPQPSQRDSARGLSDALREGAFAVLDRPVQLEAMLEAVRRIVARHYAHIWQSPASPQTPAVPTAAQGHGAHPSARITRT